MLAKGKVINKMFSMVFGPIKEKIKKSSYYENFSLYPMMLPGLAYLVINNYLPMFGLSFAFKDINHGWYCRALGWMKTLPICSAPQ